MAYSDDSLWTKGRSTVKMLFIGFDALSPQILFPLRSELPNIDRLCRNGAWGTLLSYAPIPWTGPAWTSIYTGLYPQKHGVTDGWGRPINGSKCFATAEVDYCWDICNANGLSVGVFNLPVTYPPKAINRYMVSGFPTPNSRTNAITYPRKLQAELVENSFGLKAYVVDVIQMFSTEILKEDFPEIATWQRLSARANQEQFMDIVETLSRHKLEVALRLRKRYPTDVQMVQLAFLDRIGHRCGFHDHTPEITRRFYGLMDELVGALIADGPELVVIASDHGFTGDHHLQEGTVIISGNAIVPDQEISARIVDILPTVLYALDLPMPIKPPALDGQILYQVFQEQQVGEDEEIEQQLRALGYID